MNVDASSPHRLLRRELGLGGAVMLGLGAMMGTGVFVSLGLAAGVAGPWIVPAIVVAALVAACNGLSSAQLAASHAVSGGTYEYGYRYLTPAWGFSAGWMFLCAKSASAATAALGFAGYLGSLFHLEGKVPVGALAVGIALTITALVAGGTRRSNMVNILIVGLTLLALAGFVVFAAPAMQPKNFTGSPVGAGGFLQACALMFVAYTGYGRIATMGEEVKEPRRVIPRAIMVAVVLAAVVYIAVAVAAVGAYGAGALGEAARANAAPLETVLQSLGHPEAARCVAVGAMAALLGVLLNLILGLSRVVLAMGRRGDLPTAFARLNASGTTPFAAVLATGLVVAALAGLGSVKLTWSFSAFTVLVYYAITNLSALRLPRAERRYSPLFAWAGLLACVFLAFWVEWRVWLAGLAVLGAGLLWHGIGRSLRRQS